MEEKSVSVAWNWVIEALAKSDLVDAPLLYELCPHLQGDTRTAIAAREAVALKCLQALSPSPQHDVPDSQCCSDPVQSCQHNLHRIWLETGNLQKDASNDLKASVQASVNHKKARSPNSTLQLLRDIIQQPNPSVFKEISEHVYGDQCGVDVPSSKYGHPMQPQLTSVEIPRPSETSLCQQINTRNPASEITNQLREVRICNTSSGLSPKQHDSASFDVSKFPDDIEDGSKNSHKEANQTSGGELSEKIVTKTLKENDDVPWRSSDRGGAMSKGILDPVTLIETKANICMKCNKGGRLLSCSGSTCPLHFHETCLGCYVRFDDGGDFYCPMCAYSRAVAEFGKAKERESVARKELILFIGGGSNEQRKQNHNKSSEDVLEQQIHEKGECSSSFKG